MSAKKQLPMRTLIPYGMMMLPLGTAGLPLAIYIPPFYTDSIGLSFTTVGLILMLTRCLDIFVDPFIGRLCDQTNTRFGRLRPWIAVATPIMMIAVWQIFSPPAGANTGAITFFIWMAVYYISLTMITVPIYAWGVDLTQDYEERSRVAATREIFLAIGIAFAFIGPLLLVDPSTKTAVVSEAEKIANEIKGIADLTAILGYLTIILLPITVMLLFVMVKEPTPEASSGKHSNWSSLLRSRPLQILLAAQILSGLAFGINQTTAVHFFRYRLSMGQDDAQLMFSVYFLVAIFGAFLWVWIGRLIGKRRGMMLATALNAVFLAGLGIVNPDDHFSAYIVQIGSGLVYEGPLVLGASMLADVIELDILKTKLQRSASFFAVWVIARKFTEAAGAGIALPVLEQLGYSTKTAMTPDGQTALVVVNSAIPAMLALLAVVPLMAYPITRKVQGRIRIAIDRRKKLTGKIDGMRDFEENAWDESRRAQLLQHSARP